MPEKLTVIKRRTMYRKPTIKEGNRAPMAKLTEDQVVRIIQILGLELMSPERLAKAYDVGVPAIIRAADGTTWRYLARPKVKIVPDVPKRVVPKRVPKRVANGPRR